MTFSGPMSQSDALYPDTALRAVRHLMEGEYGQIKNSRNTFYRLLEEMMYGRGFEPCSAPHQEAPLVLHEPLHYRMPVWKIIADELESLCPSHFGKTHAKMAEWLREVLEKARLHEDVLAELDIFKSSLERLGVSVSVNNWCASAAVHMTLDSGQEQVAMLASLAPKLVQKLEQHIKNHSA